MTGAISKWITQKEASELTGRSLKAVNQLVRNKRVRTKELFGKRLVLSNDILNYNKKKGRPKENEN